MIYDISLTVTDHLVTWPGDPAVDIHRVHKLEEGANANVSQVCMGLHTGTHVDAPYHFLMDGAKVDEMSLDILVGPVQVVQIPDEVTVLDEAALRKAHLPQGVKRILFKTRNSHYWEQGQTQFQPDFVGIDAGGSDYLVAQGVRLVGIDYLSISPYKKSKPTHEALLKAGMVIIEGLDLSKTQPGEYVLYCLPLKLGGAEGAPARAILVG